MKKVVQNVLLLFSSLLFMLVFCEIGMRIFDKPKYNNDIVAGWKYRGKDKHTNQLGYRGQKISYSESNIVVLLLGDSQVESKACDFANIPEQLLERHLNQGESRFRVFTIGSSGYGTDQQYLALRDYFKEYRADIVLLWQTFDNDIWNNVFPTHWPKDGTIKPTFWLENGKINGPNYQLGELVRGAAKTKIGTLFQRLFHPQKDFDALWEKNYLPKPYIPLKEYKGKYMRDWDPLDENNKNEIYLKDENLINEKSHRAVRLYPRSDRMKYGLDLTKELLKRINQLTTYYNAEFNIFYTYRPNEDKMKGIIVHKRDGYYYQSSEEQLNDNINYVNHEFQIINVPILLSNWKVSENDSHLNCEANNKAMSYLATEILGKSFPGKLP